MSDGAPKIESPGFYFLPARIYHADPCPEPSLSSSIGNLILERSPAHAFVRHPRFTVQKPEKPHVDRDWGSAVHKLALGAGPEIAVVHAENWTTKEPQLARKAAYAAGEVPLLVGDYDEAKKAAAILRAHLIDEIGPKFDAELVMAWHEGDHWCRTMIDAASPDKFRVVDIKTTGVCAKPNEDLDRHIDNQGYDFQHGFIERGLDALHPDGRGRRKFANLFQENEPPYATTFVEIPESALHFARRQVRAAINLWCSCMDSNEWPGYPRQARRYEKPAWSQNAWLAREISDPTINIDEEVT